jgi:PEP-CTERM motif
MYSPMKHVTKLLYCTALLGASAFASTTYVVDNAGQLYSLVNGTTTLTAIGSVEPNVVTTIADYNNTLYGVDTLNNNLYSITTSGGVETLIATLTQTGLTALTADAAGNLWAANAGHLYELSRTGTLLNSYTGSFNAGDLEFIGTTLYMTQNTSLYTVSLGVGTATATAVASLTLPAATVGLSYNTWVANPTVGSLEGFTTTGTYVVPTSAAATPTATGLTGLVGGRTIVDAASDAVPEPASMGLIGLGLVTLGGFAYRRRKA